MQIWLSDWGHIGNIVEQHPQQSKELLTQKWHQQAHHKYHYFILNQWNQGS